MSYYLGTSKEKADYNQKYWSGIYGMNNPIKGVVIHDSASGINATASSVAQYTVANMNVANYHWVVDDRTNCYWVVGEQTSAYHLASEHGNRHFLGIEIAPSLTGGNFANQAEKDKYHAAWIEACKLAADVLIKYNLTTDQIFQHNEFSNTACPYSMKMYFGSYTKALDETKKQVAKFMNPVTKKYWAKGKYRLDISRFDPNGHAWWLMEIVAATPVWCDKELTQKDTAPDFKVGDYQLSYSVGKNTKGDHVHAFQSVNGKTYYYIVDKEL